MTRGSRCTTNLTRILLVIDRLAVVLHSTRELSKLVSHMDDAGQLYWSSPDEKWSDRRLYENVP